MKATLQISVRTDQNPIYISLSINDRDEYNFSNGKRFTHKINSNTLYYDFLMTDLEFRVKKNKIKHLDDFDVETVFTLEIEVCENRLKELKDLHEEFLSIDEDSEDELYKWIKKALSEFKKQYFSVFGVQSRLSEDDEKKYLFRATFIRMLADFLLENKVRLRNNFYVGVRDEWVSFKTFVDEIPDDHKRYEYLLNNTNFWWFCTRIIDEVKEYKPPIQEVKVQDEKSKETLLKLKNKV